MVVLMCEPLKTSSLNKKRSNLNLYRPYIVSKTTEAYQQRGPDSLPRVERFLSTDLCSLYSRFKSTIRPRLQTKITLLRRKKIKTGIASMESQSQFQSQQPQPVCVVAQHFLAPYPIELTVQRKALTLSGGDFTVSDSNGNVVLKVAGKAMSLHDRRLLQDAAGNPLLTMKQKTFSLHCRWEVFKGDSSEDKNFAFTAKQSSIFQLKTALDVFLAGNKDEKVSDFHVKGSYLDRSCTVYQGDRILAEMKRKHTAGSILLGKDKFAVVVQPGVDYAFIVALIIILDEINKEGTAKD